MKQLFVAFITIIGIVVGALLWLRFASRKRHLPCPPWLTCYLENPYFDAVGNARMVIDRAGVGEGMRVLDVGFLMDSQFGNLIAFTMKFRTPGGEMRYP